MNQCDGCRAKMKLERSLCSNNWLHVDGTGRAVMMCQADRYLSSFPITSQVISHMGKIWGEGNLKTENISDLPYTQREQE